MPAFVFRKGKKILLFQPYSNGFLCQLCEYGCWKKGGGGKAAEKNNRMRAVILSCGLWRYLCSFLTLFIILTNRLYTVIIFYFN
jgi:hypothetical protein